MSAQGELLDGKAEDPQAKTSPYRPRRARERQESTENLIDQMRQAMRVVLANRSDVKEAN
jgi:hypothetical protein